MEKIYLLVEAVVVSFMMGGIIGAIVALHLRSAKDDVRSDARMTGDPIPVKTRDSRTRHR